MTLPDRCDTCGAVLMPWDPEEDTPCHGCGSTVKTWEHLTPEQARQRMRVIAAREKIVNAAPVNVQGELL